MPNDEVLPVEKKAKKLRHAFVDQKTGQVVSMSAVPKLFRDALAYHNGVINDGARLVTEVNFSDRLSGRPFVPGRNSPICQKCELDANGANHPYFEAAGPAKPVVTIVVDSISGKEDARGELGHDGQAGFIAKIIEGMEKETGVSLSEVRWSPLTRCSSRQGKLPNFSTKGRWCKIHLVQDLEAARPGVVIPVGSAALGALSHKSNAQDWSGRVLTYRGWPDDWLTDPEFMLQRPGPGGIGEIGHHLLGQAPSWKIPLVPLQSPRIVWASQNPHIIARWKKSLAMALKLAKSGMPAREYDRPWYNISTNPAEIIAALAELSRAPGKTVCYDTETTGLKAYAPGAAVVFLMFRWDGDDGHPRSIGFPWDYPQSPLAGSINELAPHVLEALYASKLVGHNLTFDILFSAANIPGANLDRLASSMKADTWHMAYTLRQATGTLGLEALAYDWVPDLAGYEEDMTLLIELHRELMDPAAGQGGHYAMCPSELWPTHLKTYVMGDVEVCFQAHEKIEAKLAAAKTYKIPLAHPAQRGRYRLFSPPSREWAYKNVIAPASQVLARIMGRGLFVDQDELANQEDIFPKKVKEVRAALRSGDERIVNWCEAKENTIPGWELDLENKDILKELLFDLLQLPVQRLTKGGQKVHGERPEDLEGLTREELIQYAAMDKYTLNKMSVDHPEVRPLQEYRKVFKQYAGFVRPMRNFFSDKALGGVDKKERKGGQHLARDGCVHANFKITGTRTGRTACAEPNLQQIPREGIIKRLYCSRWGRERGYIYQADLSQIELRLLAAACGDASMVEAYWNGTDLHSLTHSKIYGKPYDQCTNEHMEWLQRNGRDTEAKRLKEERKVAKTVNFLTGYGGGAFGLQTSLASQGIYKSLEECEQILESFFDSYPALRQFLSYYKRFIMDNGVAVSIMGRVRVFEEIFGNDSEAQNKALRAGCNHLIQSTASDMMVTCLAAIDDIMRAEGMESILVSTVHDSLLIDAVKEEIPDVHEIVTGVLNNIPEVMKLKFGDAYDTSWCIVPFAGDAELGRNYADAVKISNTPDWNQVFQQVDAD